MTIRSKNKKTSERDTFFSQIDLESFVGAKWEKTIQTEQQI